MTRGLRGRGLFLGETCRQCRSGDLVLVDSRHPRGSLLARHRHELAYFCFNHGGTYRETYGRKTRVCRSGMLVIHPAGEFHSETHESDVASLNVEIGPEWLRRLLDFGGALDQPLEFCGDRVSKAGRLLLTEFERTADVADRDGALAIESLTWEILAEAVDRGGARGAGKDRPRWVERARELVEHGGVGSGLAQVAAEVGVHPVHLAATFRRFYGCSIGEYSRRRRLEHARRLLADRSLNLAQVAVEAGFADQSHLTRAFRRHAGVTPARYRTFLAFKTR